MFTHEKSGEQHPSKGAPNNHRNGETRGTFLGDQSMQQVGTNQYVLWNDCLSSKTLWKSQRIGRRRHCCIENREPVRCNRGQHPRSGHPLILRGRLGTSCPGASSSSMSTASKIESIEPTSRASQEKSKSFKIS